MMQDLIHALARFQRAASVGAVALIASLGTPSMAAMPENYTPPEQYTWSAELVGFDAASRRATVRARTTTQTRISASAGLEKGEDVYLTWSGLRFAHAVRAINRDAADAPSPLTIPVEFEAVERDGSYVTFSFLVPDSAATSLATLEPGHWVTATSLSYPFESREAVVAIRPYNDVE